MWVPVHGKVCLVDKCRVRIGFVHGNGDLVDGRAILLKKEKNF